MNGYAFKISAVHLRLTVDHEFIYPRCRNMKNIVPLIVRSWIRHWRTGEQLYVIQEPTMKDAFPFTTMRVKPTPTDPTPWASSKKSINDRDDTFPLFSFSHWSRREVYTRRGEQYSTNCRSISNISSWFANYTLVMQWVWWVTRLWLHYVKLLRQFGSSALKVA